MSIPAEIPTHVPADPAADTIAASSATDTRTPEREASLGDCSDPRIHAYGVTVEAMARLDRIFDRSFRERCGITHSWFEAMLRIERSGGSMTMGELAEQIALTSGGVTRLVDRLVEAGLAERRSCETDRRVQYVAITAAGRDRLALALDVHLDDLERHFNRLMSPSERQALAEVMERVRAGDHS